MNRLQRLDTYRPLFVSLNPLREPRADSIHATFTYEHPLFDNAAIDAQRRISTIQGRRGLWFCGSYCGHGFHEDALQSGFAVAAALGCTAPWAYDIKPASPAAAAAGPLPVAAE
jgi:predicted NAD/FAD-binding protein